VSPEASLVEEDGADRTNHFDRADAKDPFVMIKIIDLFARVENERASAIMALLVENDGGLEVIVFVI
jgi:hypothetical protein|tara:strand:- start:16753 stop:16953 length:201 start_codon:yes stop_codon:yes gene_type:complete